MIEREIAELMGHGRRQARYVGQAKQRFQALGTAAGVNLKRQFALSLGETHRLAVALSAPLPRRDLALIG